MVILRGNLGATPSLNYVGTELEAVTNGTVFTKSGSNMRGETHEDVPMRFSAWGAQAAFIAETFEKGDWVTFVCDEYLEHYTDKNGEKRQSTVYRVIAALSDEAQKELYAEIRRYCREANEENFGIPNRVSLSYAQEDGQEPEQEEATDSNADNTEAFFPVDLSYEAFAEVDGSADMGCNPDTEYAS
ncbi:MAG: single-stranded DNA-binding protein [Oscillospiraceae bacterium]|jgi:single-stranded DNA-binding protein|nr:single-stranded DNA-binding protein [Oscillospiraceae bacterium]